MPLVSFFTRLALGALILGACNQSSGATPRQRNEAGRQHAQGATLKVWPVGDSITEGVEGGYRNRLYQLLRQEHVDIDYVGTLHDDSARISDKQHEGHPGFTISNAQENVDQWLTTVPPPDVVLVMLGTNDFAWWTNVPVTEHHGYFVKFVDHLLQRLPKASIVVSTIPPQSPKLIEDVKLDRAKMSAEFNTILRRTVPSHPAYGKRLFLADAARELALSDLSDGIHPTKRGHEKIAGVWFNALKPAL
jgi:lysophospholipase L1-like esterase